MPVVIVPVMQAVQGEQYGRGAFEAGETQVE